jgi:leucyl aminopeptidase
MKSTALLLPLYTAALAASASHPKDQVVLQEPQLTITEPDEYLIELSPGETRWITENEKWELRKVGSVSFRGPFTFYTLKRN